MEGYLMCKPEPKGRTDKIRFDNIPELMQLIDDLSERIKTEHVLCCFDAKENGFVVEELSDGKKDFLEPADFYFQVDDPEFGLDGYGWTDISVELGLKGTRFELVHCVEQRFSDLIEALKYGHKVAQAMGALDEPDDFEFLVSTSMHDEINFSEFLTRRMDRDYELEP